MENRWFAAMRDREDSDWGYGSYDLEEAKEMLAGMCTDDGLIAVIEDDICVEELTYDELFDVKLVVVDRVGSDEWTEIVADEEDADKMWDKMTAHDKGRRDDFYLCESYMFDGNVVSEIRTIKRYK